MSRTASAECRRQPRPRAIQGHDWRRERSGGTALLDHVLHEFAGGNKREATGPALETERRDDHMRAAAAGAQV